MTEETYNSFKWKLWRGLVDYIDIWQTLLKCPVFRKQLQCVTTIALLVMTDQWVLHCCTGVRECNATSPFHKFSCSSKRHLFPLPSFLNSDSPETAQPPPVKSQDSMDVRPAPASTTPAAVLKPTAPLGSAKGWQPPNQAGNFLRGFFLFAWRPLDGSGKQTSPWVWKQQASNGCLCVLSTGQFAWRRGEESQFAIWINQ